MEMIGLRLKNNARRNSRQDSTLNGGCRIHPSDIRCTVFRIGTSAAGCTLFTRCTSVSYRPFLPSVAATSTIAVAATFSALAPGLGISAGWFCTTGGLGSTLVVGCASLATRADIARFAAVTAAFARLTRFAWFP
jgi:hypothetical protein